MVSKLYGFGSSWSTPAARFENLLKNSRVSRIFINRPIWIDVGKTADIGERSSKAPRVHAHGVGQGAVYIE
jgi:hypothetical protein